MTKWSNIVFLFFLIQACTPVSRSPIPIEEARLTQVLAQEHSFLLVFWAKPCGSCQRLLSMLDALAPSTPIPIYLMDVLTVQEVPERYGFVTTPTFLFFKNGRLEARLEGTQSSSKILEYLNKLK
ncbi:MAG: thioredoxin family protein [Bernardetiaceae bacterium]